MINDIRKILLCILSCGLLFCGACSGMSENDTEANTSGEAAMERTESTSSRDTNVQKEILWSNHAFLLGGEDVFFASIPDEWKVFLGESGAVNIFCPDEKSKDGIGKEYFYMMVTDVYEDAFSYESEEVVFADGQIGKRYVERYKKMDGREDEGSYIEGLISPDEQYVIYLCNYDYGLTKGQYERHKDTLEQFYSSASFQKSQIGINASNAQIVRLHIKTNSKIELDIPEGSMFEKVMEHDAVCLKFYLDSAKDSVISLYLYGCQYFWDEAWENQRMVLMDSGYSADALCYYRELNGKAIGQFSFLGYDLIAEFSVPEDDQEMREKAENIIKSISFR